MRGICVSGSRLVDADSENDPISIGSVVIDAPPARRHAR